jgi:hypothetical protein
MALARVPGALLDGARTQLSSSVLTQQRVQDSLGQPRQVPLENNCTAAATTTAAAPIQSPHLHETTETITRIIPEPEIVICNTVTQILTLLTWSMALKRFFRCCNCSARLVGDSGLLGGGGAWVLPGFWGTVGRSMVAWVRPVWAFVFAWPEPELRPLAMAVLCLWGCPWLLWRVPPTWHSFACHAPSFVCLARPSSTALSFPDSDMCPGSSGKSASLGLGGVSPMAKRLTASSDFGRGDVATSTLAWPDCAASLSAFLCASSALAFVLEPRLWCGYQSGSCLRSVLAKVEASTWLRLQEQRQGCWITPKRQYYINAVVHMYANITFTTAVVHDNFTVQHHCADCHS